MAKIWSGQNKYWGSSVQKATEFWLNLDINHIMIKKTPDLPLVDYQGKVLEENFDRLAQLQSRYEVSYHLHPYNLLIRGAHLTSSRRQDHLILIRIYRDFDRFIQQYGLYPLISMHCGRMSYPEGGLCLSETEALKESKLFFQNLDLKTKISLETLFDPQPSKDDLLGFKPDHFLILIDQKDFGITIDTGHINMIDRTISSFLDLPYSISSVHLHGNNGLKDQHQLPTKNNVGDFSNVIATLQKCQGPIVFEILNKDSEEEMIYSTKQVQECVRFWQETIERGDV